MTSFRSHLLGASAAFLVLPLLGAMLNWNGPPAWRTGAPGEGTCADAGCHATFAPDSGPGGIEIAAPATYAAGDTLDLTIRVHQSGRRRYGFEITAMDPSGTHAGEFVRDDPDTKFANNLPVYVSHFQPRPADDEQTWTTRWVAPAGLDGEVTFYAAGVASDEGPDVSVDDDYVYTTSRTIGAGATSAEAPAAPATTRLVGAAPNPAGAATTLHYTLGAPSPVTVTLHDAAGRTVRTLPLGHRPAGPHAAALSLADLAPGVYVAALATSTARLTTTVVVR